MISTHVFYPWLGSIADVFSLDSNTQIPHESWVPLILVTVEQVIRSLPCEEIDNQFPQRIVLQESKRLEDNECIAGSWNTVRGFRKNGNLVDDGILACFYSKLVHQAIQMKQPEVRRFQRLFSIYRFVIEAPSVDPEKKIVKDVGTVFR